MSAADLSHQAQAAQFLAALAPGESHFTFQTYTDGPEKPRRDPLAQIIHGTLSANYAKLAELNDRGAGVYVMVNAGDGRGRRTANVQRVRAVFLDLDGAPLEPVEAAMPAAHIVQASSPGRYQVFWRVSDLRLRDFTDLQKLLAKRFDGDKKVIDLPRVMRVPGFNNRKRPDPFRVEIIRLNADQPAYSYDDLRAALRPLAGAREGERNDACFRLCASLRARSVPLEQARLEVLQFALRCTPALPEQEALRTLEGAYTRYPAGFNPEIELRDSDHYRLAQAVVEKIERETGERPVYAQGALWSVEDSIWTARTLDNVAVDVARLFAGGKYCKRGSDFASIANVVAKLCENEKFFEESEVGIAGPGGFWRVTGEGDIQREVLTPRHRQRMRVAADPDFAKEPRVLLKVLADAFADKEPEAQTRLVQQLFGCAITRSLWRYRVVALLLGATSSGKSTLLSLLSSVFPREQLGACGPQKWANEYYVAALAGVALNVVGDLDKKEPIPGYFKNVVGRDLIQGRHPTHRPFTFVCEASHFFNSNHCPPTADHSDAFFNRWRVVHFKRSVPPKDRDRDLDRRLIAEETGAMLGWALRGAAEVARAGAIMETQTHAEVIQRWRVANNSALAFLVDECQLSQDENADVLGQDLYKAYRIWATDNGLRPFGRNGFYEALTEGAGVLGIQVIPRESSTDHQVHVIGVRLPF